MKPRKVLIVDDSETIRRQVAEALAPAGFEVVEAADGVEGLERAAQHELSLMILDVNMPRLSGLEMLEKLKRDPRGAKIPVLMLTTEVQQSMVDRAKKSGAIGWMIKPVKLDLLVSTVNKAVGT
ncbi:MAG TPA: response regulator [Polyangiaceae bacterium]|nr:response regulator [Polyangiaceae bacterium]